MSKEYYVNELSFEGQFPDPPARQFEREVALLSDVYDILREKGLSLHLSRAVLRQPVCFWEDGARVKFTVEDMIEEFEQGIASFFWERIGAWTHASIEEFGAVSVFFAGKDISDFGPARSAVHCYLDPSTEQRLFSSATSTTCSANALNFGIHQEEQPGSTPIRITNLTSKNAVITDLGGVAAPPSSWRETLRYYAEEFEHVRFTTELEQMLLLEPWNANLFEQVTGKLQRLNDIVGTSVALQKARRGRDGQLVEDLEKQYNEQYSDMFEHKSSPFSDESDSRKRNLRKKMTFRITGDRTEFCPFHTKFSYKTFRLHFSWPVPDTDDATYVVHLGKKIL